MVCVYVCVCPCTYAHYGLWVFIWVPGIELRSPAFVASSFTHGIILLAQECLFMICWLFSW